MYLEILGTLNLTSDKALGDFVKDDFIKDD